MSCRNNWTIRFPEINSPPFEIRPKTMSLKLGRRNLDYCRARFSHEVGSQMKPETTREGILDILTPADVLYNGEKVKRLLFRPDWVDYSQSETTIQFHDIQKSLNEGRIDFQSEEIKIKDIYKRVINGKSAGIIPEITDDNFLIDDVSTQELKVHPKYDPFGKDFAFKALFPFADVPSVEEEKEDNTRFIENTTAIDFDNITAAKALTKLNKKFGLKSWANGEGELLIGRPEQSSLTHVAADNDDRVWRYKNPTINHGQEPIKRVLVEGPWAHTRTPVGDTGTPVGDTAIVNGYKEVKSWFSNEEGPYAADIRVYGVAERTDIEYGTVLTEKVPKATMGSIDDVAESIFRQKMENENGGTVKIDPRLSGHEVSHPVDLKPGDYLQMIPNDRSFDNPTKHSGTLKSNPDTTESCQAFIYNETYLVDEVEHNVSESGSWNVQADVSITTNVPINSGTAYFNPNSEEWLGENKITDDGTLKGGFTTKTLR